MDGWETRRMALSRQRQRGRAASARRGASRRGYTSYFTGNYPPEVSVEACGAEGYLAPHELAAAD